LRLFTFPGAIVINEPVHKYYLKKIKEIKPLIKFDAIISVSNDEELNRQNFFLGIAMPKTLPNDEKLSTHDFNRSKKSEEGGDFKEDHGQ